MECPLMMFDVFDDFWAFTGIKTDLEEEFGLGKEKSDLLVI